MNRFEGKSVIVTGAASGFGTAIARKFANEGAQIICADLNMAGASELASELANAVPFEIDVANEQQNKDMIAVRGRSLRQNRRALLQRRDTAQRQLYDQDARRGFRQDVGG